MTEKTLPDGGLPARAGQPGVVRGRLRRVGMSVADTLELPRDVVLNLPRLSIVGNLQLTIENFHGVVECGPERVRVALNRGQVAIWGRQLAIAYVHAEEILLTGIIDRIEFIA
jgi:sporulation protein YqfC